MFDIDRCPSCGSRKIKRVRRTWKGSHAGEDYTVPALVYHECPDCGETIFQSEAMRKIESYSPAFAKKRRKTPRRSSAAR